MATNPAGLSHESTSRVDGFFWLRGKMMGDEKWGFLTGWDGARLACPLILRQRIVPSK